MVPARFPHYSGVLAEAREASSGLGLAWYARATRRAAQRSFRAMAGFPPDEILSAARDRAVHGWGHPPIASASSIRARRQCHAVSPGYSHSDTKAGNGQGLDRAERLLDRARLELEPGAMEPGATVCKRKPRAATLVPDRSASAPTGLQDRFLSSGRDARRSILTDLPLDAAAASSCGGVRSAAISPRHWGLPGKTPPHPPAFPQDRASYDPTTDQWCAAAAPPRTLPAVARWVERGRRASLVSRSGSRALLI